MRKLIAVVALLLVASTSKALLTRLSRIGPTFATLASWGVTPPISKDQASSIAAAGSGIRNCLSNLTFIANSTSTVRILDGGTTVYALDLAASSLLQESWDNDDMCGTANTALIVKISTGHFQATAGTQQLSYTGFTY